MSTLLKVAAGFAAGAAACYAALWLYMWKNNPFG